MASDESYLRQFKAILLEYGDDLTPDKYDGLDIPNKPSRKTLRKKYGTWQATKVMALGDNNVINNSYLIDQNEKLIKRLEKQRNLNQVVIENCLASISKVSFHPAKVPCPEQVKHNLEFHGMRSDDHAGELVDPNWVQGLSEYNSDLYKKRVDLWTEKVMLFREQDKNSLGLNKLVLHFLGDHLTGESIYAGQAYSIDLSATDQLLMSVETNVNCILKLAEAFPAIEIFGVIGNHGRVGKKGESHHRTNFDYLFFRMLQMALQQQENVRVYVSDSPTMLVRHGNFNFGLNHNDDVISYMGIPYYGLERKARRMSDLYGITVHYKLGGHFHQPANLNDEIFLNGTLVGGSDLSINKMHVSSVPSQKIFYFDNKYGINRESNLYLAKPTKLIPDVNGIYTAYS